MYRWPVGDVWLVMLCDSYPFSVFSSVTKKRSLFVSLFS